MNTAKLFPVLLTPFDLKAKIDYSTVGRLIDFYLAAGAQGFFVNCFTSEMYSLSEEESLEQAKFVVKFVNRRVPVLATGSFGLTIYDKAEFSKKIFGIGLDAVILITSHFANVEDEDEILLKNFEHIFRLTNNIPMGLYECSVPYKRILNADVFAKLAATGRVFHHKDATVDLDLLKAKVDVAKEHPSVQLYQSYSPNTLDALQFGANGISSLSATFFPEIVSWMCNNATNTEKQNQLKWIQDELTRVDELLHDAFPMSLKYFLRKRGFPIRLISRAYFKELTGQQKKTLDEVYNNFLKWCPKLQIQPVDVEAALMPNVPLDPAF